MKNMHSYNDFKNNKTKINENIEEVIEEKIEEVEETTTEEVIEESVEETTEETVEETTEDEEVNESAQLYDDTWKVRTRVELPSSLISAYVKKVQQETGEDPRKKWSEQEIAEEITKFVTTSYLTIENLPVSIISNAQAEPTVQTQEEMPDESQVQAQVQSPEEAPVQGQGQVEVEIESSPQSEVIAQSIPQSQGGEPGI
jgi:hypothetical protein